MKFEIREGKEMLPDEVDIYGVNDTEEEALARQERYIAVHPPMSFMAGLSFFFSLTAILIPQIFRRWWVGCPVASTMSLIAIIPAIAAVVQNDRRFGWVALGIAVVLSLAGIIPFLL